MSITLAQQEALAQLQAITNSADVDRDRAVLERVDWDVQRAIQRIFDGDDEPPAPQTSGPSSSHADTSEPPHVEPMEIDDSSQGTTPTIAPRRAEPNGFYPLVARLFGVLSYPFTVSFGLFAGVLQFVFRVLRIPFPRLSGTAFRFGLPGGSSNPASRRPTRPGSAIDAAERWVRELEDATGAMSVTRAAVSSNSNGAAAGSDGLRRREKGDARGNLLPDFWMGDYESALKAAQKEAKVICVILVSEEHDDTAEFKRTVLTDPDFVRDLTDNQFIVWGGDVRDREAYQTSLKLSATGYPFVAFISLHPRPGSRGLSSSPQLTVISRHQGSPSTQTSATTLHTHITNTLLPRVNPLLTRIRNESRLREQERELRAEQDRAFERARKVDHEREQQRRDKERKQKEEEAERVRQTEELKLKEVQKEEWRRWRKATLPSEPKFGGLRVGVRLPNGQRIIRMFSPSEPVEVLYAFVDVQFLLAGNNTPAPTSPPAGYVHQFDFGLATAYPRKEVPLVAGMLLSDVDVLKGGANLVVEAKAGARLSSEVEEEDDYDDENDN